MRECRNWVSYMLLPTMVLIGQQLGDSETHLQGTRDLVTAIRLIAGFSAEPVNPCDIDEAQLLLNGFCSYMIANCGIAWLTYKNHNVSVHFNFLIHCTWKKCALVLLHDVHVYSIVPLLHPQTHHATMDMVNFKCHFDHLSAYKFESMHSIWKYLLHKGPNMHLQLLSVLCPRDMEKRKS